LPNNIYLQNYPLIPAEVASTSNVAINDVPSLLETSSPSSSFQTGGNLEELLYDIEALSKDIMNLQTQCVDMPNDNAMTAPKTKPFRSELNLVLSYPNDTSVSSEVKENSNDNTNDSVKTPLLLQTLPSPYPSSTFPSSPITPPTNFNNNDFTERYFENKLPNDYSHLRFTSGVYSSNNSIFCTVSAPSTPSTDRRKCIEKFCSSENANDAANYDKKKAKRVSIVNMPKEIVNEKSNEPTSDNKDGESKDNNKKSTSDANCASNSCHHSHNHKNHSHHPKRRMSLDSTTVNIYVFKYSKKLIS
jgi:hypothetical protein